MLTSDLGFASATDLTAAIRAGRLSSREILDVLLERVASLDESVHAVTALDTERARKEADLADAEAQRGESRGPLHGLPMTIKDSYQTAHLRTTCGAPEYADFIPRVDAVPVARLKAAGAVVFGKTNLPIWANDTQSYNELFPTTNNPYDPERTAGGSSGGAAAALAAGFTPLELGSDIGGSIRGPAATCGVTGHKPSYGIVPFVGQIPGPPGTLTEADLAVAGPMARTVDDLELGLDVLAGPNDWNSTGWQLRLPAPRHSHIRDYRVATWSEEESAPIAQSVARGLEDAARALEDAGATVHREQRPDFSFDYAVRVYLQLLGAAQAGGYSPEEIEAMAAVPEEGDGLAPGHYAQRHRAWLSANERRLQMRRKWHQYFGNVDAVLMPALPTPAIPHDHSEPQAARTIDVDGASRPYLEQISWAGLTGVAWLPGTVVPVAATADGLPIGIQVVGPFLEDRTSLFVARFLERSLGGFRRPPGF